MIKSTQNKIEKSSELKEKLKEKFIKWSESSTTHGYPNIFRANLIILKIFWFICLMISLGFCVYFIVNTVMEYSKYDVNTKIEKIVKRPIEFPTVRICNLNHFLMNNSREYIFDIYKNVFGYPVENFTHLIKYLEKEEFLPTFSALQIFHNDPDISNEEKKYFGIGFNESFIKASFTDNRLNQNDFEWIYDGNYGNCYDFNSGYDFNGAQVHLKTINWANSEFYLELFTGLPQNMLMPEIGKKKIFF